ncbi:hypothetical protein FOBRF1_012325 [Fusarium oxysporum]
MLVSTALLALSSVAFAAATPAPAQNPETDFSFWLGGPILEKCLAEKNCEDRLLDNPYYVDAKKTNHAKRYSCHGAGMHTVITSGKNFVKFGSFNPYDLFHHVYDLCHEGGCDSGSDWARSTKYVTATGIYSKDIKVSAQGVYSGWDMRNALAQSLADASGRNQVWSEEVACPSGGRACSRVKAWQGYAPNFHQSAIFNNCNQYGWMNAKTDGLTGITSGGDCKSIVEKLGAIIGETVPFGAGTIPLLGALCG